MLHTDMENAPGVSSASDIHRKRVLLKGWATASRYFILFFLHLTYLVWGNVGKDNSEALCVLSSLRKYPGIPFTTNSSARGVKELK